MKKLVAGAIALLMVAACGPTGGGAGNAGAQGIWATGSSTVFPFTTRVAETYAQRSGGVAPRVESAGTGGGINAFCQGVGAGTPDIANASRPMKQSEFDTCVANGVDQILEIQIGSDGIVIATARDGADFNFRLQDLYMALAAEVPNAGGQLGANTYAQWSQVNPALPAQAITVYGPPPTSGTRDAFLELGMTPGAEEIPSVAALADSDEDRFEAVAHTLREDGRWTDMGENDNVIVQTLTRTPGSVGVFGYSFLEENLTSVRPALINGVEPNAATIADGSYPLSRSLFLYVKISHLQTTPGLAEFLEEYLSDGAAGPDGYLADRGLIPLQADRLAAAREALRARTPMARPAS
jgi:phosphate transport system substrate-binding protein